MPEVQTHEIRISYDDHGQEGAGAAQHARLVWQPVHPRVTGRQRHTAARPDPRLAGT
jgi:hypothetical protein